MLNEVWKDIAGYEGRYLISNYGRILSLYNYRPNGKAGYYQETREMKKSMTSTGYYKIELTKNRNKKSYKVHRLVAIHFIPNPYGKETVNHIDGNPLNNHYENLEWLTQKENVNHAIETGLTPTFQMDKRSIEHLYIHKNMSLAKIGELFDISTKAVDRVIKEYGIYKETPTTYRIDEEWLKQQFNKGRKNKDIAQEIGCDQSLISVYKTRIGKGESIYVNK